MSNILERSLDDIIGEKKKPQRRTQKPRRPRLPKTVSHSEVLPYKSFPVLTPAIGPHTNLEERQRQAHAQTQKCPSRLER